MSSSSNSPICSRVKRRRGFVPVPADSGVTFSLDIPGEVDPASVLSDGVVIVHSGALLGGSDRAGVEITLSFLLN